MKYIILARPSALIITDMKRLISKIKLEAKPLSHLGEIWSYDPSEVGAIVISTALSSSIKEKYWEVIAMTKEIFPGKPIFLSSFASVKSTKITARAHVEQASIEMELVSIEEVKESGFDPNRQILILTQKELADSNLLHSIAYLMDELIHSNGPRKKIGGI